MHDDNPCDVTRNTVRRTAGGAPDTELYVRRAQALRAAFLRAVFACIARGWRAWACIRAKMEERASRQTLAALSARELKDLGLVSGDIEAITSGAYFADPTRDERSRGRRRVDE